MFSFLLFSVTTVFQISSVWSATVFPQCGGCQNLQAGPPFSSDLIEGVLNINSMGGCNMAIVCQSGSRIQEKYASIALELLETKEKVIAAEVYFNAFTTVNVQCRNGTWYIANSYYLPYNTIPVTNIFHCESNIFPSVISPPPVSTIMPQCGGCKEVYSSPTLSKDRVQGISTTSETGCIKTITCSGVDETALGILFLNQQYVSTAITRGKPIEFKCVGGLWYNYDETMSKMAVVLNMYQCQSFLPPSSLTTTQTSNSSVTSTTITSTSTSTTHTIPTSTATTSSTTPSTTSSTTSASSTQTTTISSTTTSTTPLTTTSSSTQTTTTTTKGTQHQDEGCNQNGFQLLSSTTDSSTASLGKFGGYFRDRLICETLCNRNYGLINCHAYMYEPKNRGKCTIFQYSVDGKIILNTNSNALVFKKC